ncbi:MAG: shikimate kinase [Steroidobacteraceae bacterium]
MLGKQNIFLIGPMGSGKSAVGKLLARHLGAPYYDSDAEIELRTGVDIPRIFDEEGEAGFREREREVIALLTAMEPVVVSTGGGAILLAENRAQLAQRGVVVYLETSVRQQAGRVQHGRHRPLLHNVDPAAKLAELMTQREPLYRGTADVTVATDGRKVQQVVDLILAAIRAPASG